MKIVNRQITHVWEQSDWVNVTEADLETLKNWAEHPYTGTTPDELAAYVDKLGDFLSYPNSTANAPEIAKELYDCLFGDGLNRHLIKEIRDNSKIIVARNDAKELGEAESFM